jgi:hypothetical protein
MDIKQLREQADQLFTKRSSYVMLLQEIAENFYPERADFTLRREIGTQFAEGSMTSYPTMTRRELADQISSMLRPTAKEWFHVTPRDEDRSKDMEAKRWQEWATTRQRKVMYDPKAMFSRATKEGDNDFSTFGQCVLSVRMNRNLNGLLYRSWHLRDVAWMENEEGQVGFVARKWRPRAIDLQRLFQGKNHQSVDDIARKTPFEEFECYHIICEGDLYNDHAKGKPYWSIYYDISHDHLLEAVPVFNREYVIPRWQTVSGSQYAFSPATITALPDARLIQAMTYTLLQAGEKAVDPPMIATQNAVKSDIGIYAGGITWVDEDYDERLGPSLRTLDQDYSKIPIGIDMMRDSRALIREAFYLNKLNLPDRGPEMTAYEVGQRVQEYVRGALPLFEPMEMNYNGALCEVTFELLLRAGAFGSPHDIPESLRGADMSFRFESPLHDAIEAQKGHKFLEARDLIAQAMTLDQSAIALLDVPTALRDVLSGISTPAEWIRDETSVEQIQQAQQAAKQSEDALAAMEQASKIQNNLGVTGAQQ